MEAPGNLHVEAKRAKGGAEVWNAGWVIGAAQGRTLA